MMTVPPAMPVSYEIEKLLHAPLEEVLLKVYPATFLRWLYDVSLRQLAQAVPDALPPTDPTQISGADRTPKKAYLIELLRRALSDSHLGRRLFEALPTATQEVLAAATWERELNLAAIERTLGQPVAEVNPDERRMYYEPFILAPEHGFLVLRANQDDPWQYRPIQAREHPRKDAYRLVLPDEVRKVFKSLVPPPPGYDLSPLDNLPKGAELHYTCADHAVADLHLVAEYIAQGHLKYTKAEREAMPSLKALRQMTGGPEFYAGNDDSDLLLLRTRCLAGGVAFASKKLREALLARAESAEPIRNLVEKTLANAAFLHEELLAHLANRYNRWSQYHAPFTKKLAAFFGQLPSGKWVTWENLRSYHSLRELVPTLFGDRHDGLQAHATKGQDTWSTYIMVAHYNALELIGEPLLKGYAFLLAASRNRAYTHGYRTH